MIYRQDLQESEEDRYYQVTKEMAIDAGDLRMEGQWVK